MDKTTVVKIKTIITFSDGKECVIQVDSPFFCDEIKKIDPTHLLFVFESMARQFCIANGIDHKKWRTNLTHVE